MTIVWIALILIGAYLFFVLGPAIVACAAIFARREGMDFEAALQPGTQFAPYAERFRAARSALQSYSVRPVEIQADDGVTLCADYYAQGGDRIAVFLHGYRSDPMLNFAVQGSVFARHGYDLLIVDQRAHGRSGGKHTTLGLLERMDLQRWVDWIKANTAAGKIVIYGMSMGAATAAYASDQLDPEAVKALILDCGFLSPYVQIAGDSRKRHLPAWLLTPVIRLLAKLRFGLDLAAPVTTPLANTRIPTFFIHGTADETVPIAQAYQQYQACSARKTFRKTEGARHTLAFPAAAEDTEQALFAFLTTEN